MSLLCVCDLGNLLQGLLTLMEQVDTQAKEKAQDPEKAIKVRGHQRESIVKGKGSSEGSPTTL